MKQEVKKLLILNLPYLLFVYLFDKIGAAIRLTPGADASEKLLQLGTGFAAAFSSIAPSLHPADLLIGIAGAVIIRLAVYMKGKNAKKYRKGMEYGSARWGGAEDIKPYIDPVFENNVLLTQTEKEVSFSDLALHEERQLYTLDKYFQDEEAEPSYQQAGKKITPKLLLEAIRTLPEEKRKAIMLYYFEGMTDVEIGKLFNTSRSTIQYRRTSSFEILKKYLEEHADEWDEW